MSIILQGLKTNKLMSQGYSFSTRVLIHYNTLKMNFGRGMLRVDFVRNALRTILGRDILRTPEDN